MGQKIRLFAGKITEDFVVRELPKETAAKARRAAANLKQKTTKGKQPVKKQTKAKAPVKKSTKGKQPGKKSTKDKQPEKKTISMSLLTYKLHALGDYAQTIRQRGTTDSYNSQTVSVLLYLEIHLNGLIGRM